MPTGDRTITVVRRPRRDKLSTAASSDPVEVTIEKVFILPVRAQEADGGWVTIEGWDIWIQDSSVVGGTRTYLDGDVKTSDFIRIDGAEWQVKGPVAPYTKRGHFKAAQFRVERVGS